MTDVGVLNKKKEKYMNLRHLPPYVNDNFLFLFLFLEK